MEKKEASEVASNMVVHVFTYFGLPYIIHSDRGKEFVNELIRNLVEQWPGSCKLINGKARSPWVQELVERTNACVEDMISCKQRDLQSNEWASYYLFSSWSTCQLGLTVSQLGLTFSQLGLTFSQLGLTFSQLGLTSCQLSLTFSQLDSLNTRSSRATKKKSIRSGFLATP
ncbi:KRAB-A domain-containing protein 2-like [Hydractinia symbiolongicarpus]|uniref:KRAB-A domain-containing protein 2-like n=1 Tax=Hydractinia symbiolongicarpus TaxID=13093 RepID=UPI00254B73A2|nr:KRAB-A domain-containing protein 2-like [Hydractinia symbiolongicarpus]